MLGMRREWVAGIRTSEARVQERSPVASENLRNVQVSDIANRNVMGDRVTVV